jgi:ABC-type multidrug transport system ATPase subunit
MIVDIQLADKADWQSRLLSGGMKRKLRLAMNFMPPQVVNVK